MNNLFILHTQYNLVLAVGLTKTKFKDDTNDLILFTDFPLNSNLENKCKLLFDHSIFLSGSYPKSNETYLRKIKRYPQIINEINNFIKLKYDNVFIVDDMCIPEMYCLKKTNMINDKTAYYWLEDGGIAYFVNGVKSGGLSSNRITKFLRKLIFKYFFGLGKYYHLADYMGGHYLLDTAFVTYPSYIRKEYLSKNLVKIEYDSFMVGLTSIYDKIDIKIRSKALLILLDKLSVYKDLQKLTEGLINTIYKYKNEGYVILYKYHPREEERLDILEQYVELERGISIESYYASMDPNNISVLGIKSTGLQTAKMLGYNTLSMIKSIDPEESQVLDFYEKIGIRLI